METDMTEMTLYGGLVAMLYLFAAISAFRRLRWLDRLAGLEFRRGVMPVILETSPVPRSISERGSSPSRSSSAPCCRDRPRLFWLALAAALAVPWPLSPASADSSRIA
jgi:hypothetical protein